MSETNERFLRLYEDLKAEVNKRAGDPSSHSFQVANAARRDVVVSREKWRLEYIKDIRNALSHPKHKSRGHAVLISDTFLKEVESLLNHLKRPPTANSVGVPRKEIRTASVHEKLGDLAAEMEQGLFTHVPIVDEDDVVIGVFNEAAIFDYVWSETETIVGRGMLIHQILPHCRLDADHTETFRFVGPRVQVEDLVDMFQALESPTTRLGAVFVTASGKDTEKLQRLITPWDVLGGATK